MDHQPRSHPTLNPLTPLPPSSSYIYPTTSIPNTPSLLSRPPSQTHLRSPPAHRRTIPSSKSTPTLPRKQPIHKRIGKDEGDDWITRTASTLTLTRLEEKGVSWLGVRGSSTSLTGDGIEDAGYQAWDLGTERGLRDRTNKGWDPRFGSTKSRRGSSHTTTHDTTIAKHDDRNEIPGPDFINPDEEVENHELEEGDDIDEGEMRKVVMGRVGGWVDWAVGWMDMRDPEDDEEVEDSKDSKDEREEEGEEGQSGEGGEGVDAADLSRRLGGKGRGDGVGVGVEDGNVRDTNGESGVGRPPEGEQAGVWSDTKWLLGVARKAAL